jgi:hypothetical protein
MKHFLIKTIHDVYIDSYDQGELGHVNGWAQEAKIEAENVKKAIELYFEKELYFSFNFDHCGIDEENSNELHYSNLVDGNNLEATESEIEQWKQGKKTLYTNNIYLRVFEIIPSPIV